jgi:hypothetical protein
MPKRTDPFFAGIPEVRVPHFGSGEVSGILKVEFWRLSRFLSRYELKSSGKLGQGRGSRRWYTTLDVYRIATAMYLIRDGFAPKLVAQIMQRLEDEHFYGGPNESGEFSGFGIFLRRRGAGPEVGTFRANKPPEMKADGEIYYALNLSTITRSVDRRIASLEQK